jgi:hypothetical protein
MTTLVITSDEKMAKRGLPHQELCVFCKSVKEDPHYLFICCVVVQIIWSSVLIWAGIPQVVPTAADISLQ